MPEVRRLQAVGVLLSLGYKDARSWNALEIQQKLNRDGGLLALCPRGYQIQAPNARRLFTEWVEAQRNGEGITVQETKPTWDRRRYVGPRDNPGRPKGAPKRQALPEHFREDGRPIRNAPSWVWADYWRRHPQPVPGKDECEAGRVVHELFEAGRKNAPVSKDDLAAVVVGYFPGTDLTKVRRYVDMLVPTKIMYYYSLHVWRKRFGPGQAFLYWIEGDGRAPQPFAPTDEKQSKKWSYERLKDYREDVGVKPRKRRRKKPGPKKKKPQPAA